MEKVLKIVSANDKNFDRSFWLTKSPVERLEAIEVLRQQYINYKKDVQQRFYRICNIVNKTQS